MIKAKQSAAERQLAIDKAKYKADAADVKNLESNIKKFSGGK